MISGKMTRKEAIDILSRPKTMKNTPGDILKAHEMAIEALKQEPCEDCISRRATVKRLCKVAALMDEKREGLGSPLVMAALFIQDNKGDFPSVTPQVDTARRIVGKSRGGMTLWYQCEICNEPIDERDTFCSGCGRRLVNG